MTFFNGTMGMVEYVLLMVAHGAQDAPVAAKECFKIRKEIGLLLSGKEGRMKEIAEAIIYVGNGFIVVAMGFLFTWAFALLTDKRRK